MRSLPIDFRRAYRLRPIGHRGEDAVSMLRISDGAVERTVLVPHCLGLGYFVAPAGNTSLSIASKDFRAEKLGILLSLWVRLRLALLFKKKKYLQYDAFSLFSYGPKPERKRFTRLNQDMSNIGAGLDSHLVASHRELLAGWEDDDAVVRRPARREGPNAVAIVAHIYYEDTWPDIAGALRRLAVPFDLIVTTVPGREPLAEAIRRDFPDADIDSMENRGRDVGPFLTLLERGRLDRYRYVCKVHGKKSSDGGRKAHLGALWRRRLLFDLLAAPGLARAVVDLFERDPTIGMVGPRMFRLPSDNYSEDLSWSVNRAMVLDLASKMGVPPDQFRLDFFGGTMFWVRPEALQPLRDLRLASAFPEEKGLLDGGLEHAIERLFGAAVVAAGYRLADTGGFSEAANSERGVASRYKKHVDRKSE